MARPLRLAAAALLVGVAGLSAGYKWHLPWESQEAASPPQAAAPAAPVPQPRNQVPEPKRLATVNQQPIAISDMEAAVQQLKQLAKAYNQEWKTLPNQDDPNALDLHDKIVPKDE